MLLLTPDTILSAVVTLVIVLTYFFTAFSVGRMRVRHGIKAPATSGHPVFDCAFRVQMNTLEQMPLILPLLWLATLYFHGIGWLPAAFGLLWVIGRVVYMTAYMADPSKRGAGFGITMAANLGLLILAIIGIIDSWLAVTAV